MATDRGVAIPGTTGSGMLAADDISRLRRVWAIAALPVLVVYTWLLTTGRWGFLQRQYYDDFYDEQVRAWLDGRWGVRRDVVGLEGIDVDGSVHIYFGPIPSLLRLPVMLFTDRFDGRLTTLSMLAAMLVLAVATYRLTVAVRRFVRPDAAVTRLELVLTGALSVAVLAGPPYWLASVATVHHEALLWGVALMVAALDAIARWVLESGVSRLAVASALVAATLLARTTLGWGALAALAVTGGMLAGERLMALRRAGAPSRPGILLAGMALIACAVPLAVSAVPNIARFDQPFGVPFDRQLAMHAPEWREHLERNEGELFGPRYATTTLVNYLRPNALHFRSDLPWVDYPQPTWSTVGGGEVVADPTASLPATAPLLTLWAILGSGFLLRSLVRRRGPPTRLIGLWAGSLVATVGVILLGSVAQRYLTDLYPAVLVPGLVGFYMTVGWASSGVRRGYVVMAVAGAVMLAVGATAVTTMLALQYQREQLAYIPESWRASWASRRAALPSTNSPWQVGLRDPLPAEAPDGTMAVAGDCDGLYVSVSGPEPIWRPVERGPGVDVYDLQVDLHGLRSLPVDEPAPLLTREDAVGVVVVTIARISDREPRIDVWEGAKQSWRPGPTIPLDSSEVVRVSWDIRAELNPIAHGAERFVRVPVPPAHGESDVSIGEALGADDIMRSYPGAVTLEPIEPEACRALRGG